MTRSRRFALAAVGLLALALLGAAVWLGFRGTQSNARLAFGAVQEPLGPLVLLTTAADGSDVQPAYPDARQRAHGWTDGSADMETFVFISYDNADLQAGHQVEAIDRPVGEPRLLLDVPIKTALVDLALSPDGHTLLLALAEQNGSGPPHLVSIDVPSGTSSELNLVPDTATRDLAWSPDGSNVAFVGDGCGRSRPDRHQQQREDGGDQGDGGAHRTLLGLSHAGGVDVDPTFDARSLCTTRRGPILQLTKEGRSAPGGR